MNQQNRRNFVKGTVAATALGYSRILGANDRVGIGYIGLGNRGDQLHQAFLEYGDNQTAAVCDIRGDYMDFAVRKSRAQPARYQDYRRLLEDRNVDAVVIATPDHWHALQFIDACRAGKDVYVEKPLSLTVVEGRRMVQVAGETGRVIQVGTQRRSSPAIREAVEFIRAGGIGPVSSVRCNLAENFWPAGIGNPPDEPPPSEEEWERWLGPAPKVPYNRNRSYYQFRFFWDYCGGQGSNWGVHFIDVVRWALDKDAPLKAAALGGRMVLRDNREIPDTMEMMWDFGSAIVTFSQYSATAAPCNGQGSNLEFRGAKGTLHLHMDRWEVVPETIMEKPAGALNPLDRTPQELGRRQVVSPKLVKGGSKTPPHVRNFLDNVKSRGKCNADVLTGHLSTVATLIGNIALRTESTLKWDAAAERFTNSEAANRYLQPRYRAPYKLT